MSIGVGITDILFFSVRFQGHLFAVDLGLDSDETESFHWMIPRSKSICNAYALNTSGVFQFIFCNETILFIHSHTRSTCLAILARLVGYLLAATTGVHRFVPPCQAINLAH